MKGDRIVTRIKFYNYLGATIHNLPAMESWRPAFVTSCNKISSFINEIVGKE